MSAVKLLHGASSLGRGDDTLQPASWGAVAVQCSCGKVTDSMVHPTLRAHGLDRNAACARCGEAFTTNRRVVRGVDEAVRVGSLARANQLLLSEHDKLERLAALMQACPHCGKPLATADAVAAAEAILKIVDPAGPVESE